MKPKTERGEKKEMKLIWTRVDDGSDFVRANTYTLPEPVVVWLLERIAAINRPTDAIRGYFNNAPATTLTATYVMDFLFALGCYGENE